MRAYSLDLRSHILGAVKQGVPKPVVAQIFGVSRRSIDRYQQQERETGDLRPRPIPGRRRLIGPDETGALWAQLERMPTATLADHCAQWATEHEVRPSTATMSRQIRRLGWTRKKGQWRPPKPMPQSGPPGGSRSPTSTASRWSSSTRVGPT